jgi:hypothetical protein
VPGRKTNEGINASPVVVWTGARPGRIAVHLGITSDGPATKSTQLAGRGGCARRNWIERTDGAKSTDMTLSESGKEWLAAGKLWTRSNL